MEERKLKRVSGKKMKGRERETKVPREENKMERRKKREEEKKGRK